MQTLMIILEYMSVFINNIRGEFGMQRNELDWNKLSSYSEEEALIMEAEEEILEQMDVLDAILKAFGDEENEDED